MHVRKDALLRKRRPIVTGEISFKAAWTTMAALFVLGSAGALIAGVMQWAALLIAMIFLYNWLAAGRVEGVTVRNPAPRASAAVAVIAFCRALHVSLPLLAHGQVQILTRQPLWWIFAGSVFAYFCLVTVISLFEDGGGGRGALRLISYLLYPVALVLPVYAFTRPGGAEPVFGILLPLAVLGWLLFGMHRTIDRARAAPTPPNLGRAVGAGIRGECLLMCGFALILAPAQWWWGLLALACFPAGKLLSRWFSPT
jgi:hypothetical protein